MKKYYNLIKMSNIILLFDFFHSHFIHDYSYEFSSMPLKKKGTKGNGCINTFQKKLCIYQLPPPPPPKPPPELPPPLKLPPPPPELAGTLVNTL